MKESARFSDESRYDWVNDKTAHFLNDQEMENLDLFYKLGGILPSQDSSDNQDSYMVLIGIPNGKPIICYDCIRDHGRVFASQ